MYKKKYIKYKKKFMELKSQKGGDIFFRNHKNNINVSKTCPCKGNNKIIGSEKTCVVSNILSSLPENCKNDKIPLELNQTQYTKQWYRKCIYPYDKYCDKPYDERTTDEIEKEVNDILNKYNTNIKKTQDDLRNKEEEKNKKIEDARKKTGEKLRIYINETREEREFLNKWFNSANSTDENLQDIKLINASRLFVEAHKLAEIYGDSMYLLGRHENNRLKTPKKKTGIFMKKVLNLAMMIIKNNPYAPKMSKDRHISSFRDTVINKLIINLKNSGKSEEDISKMEIILQNNM